MVVLGILLLAGAAVLAVATISSNTGAVEMDLWGLSISNVSIGVVFAAGMVTAAVGLLGLMMVLGGARRNRKLRRERRALARDNRGLSRQADRQARADARAQERADARADAQGKDKPDAKARARADA